MLTYDESAMNAEVQSVDSSMPDHPVVFFDGVCNLCNSSVDFIIGRDREEKYRFASLQSEYARKVLPSGDVTGELNSIVLLDSGVLHRRSTAALRIARDLTGLWPLFYAFILVPAPLRDGVYRVIARYRYTWFGRSEHCRVPTPELQARFLD